MSFGCYLGQESPNKRPCALTTHCTANSNRYRTKRSQPRLGPVMKPYKKTSCLDRSTIAIFNIIKGLTTEEFEFITYGRVHNLKSSKCYLNTATGKNLSKKKTL